MRASCSGRAAASVLAASQDALPGDALYTLKVRMEQVRLDVLPAHLHDDLYAYTLSQRIDEMGRLTEAGHWQLALAMTPVIEDSYEQFAHALDEQGLASEDASRHLIVLQGLLEQLPEGARDAVQNVFDRGKAVPPVSILARHRQTAWRTAPASDRAHGAIVHIPFQKPNRLRRPQ